MAASDMVTKIDALIDDLLDNFANITTYRMSNKEVDKTEALRALTDLRAQYLAESEREPFEDIRHIAYDFDDLGRDTSEYIGDYE